MLDGEAVTIRCAHGDTVLYPLAKVDLEVRGKKISVEAAISIHLPTSVLLGTDVPALSELLGQSINERKTEEVALITVTRAQKKKQEEEEEKVAEIQQKQEEAIGARPNNLDIESDLSIQIEDEESTRLTTDEMSVEQNETLELHNSRMTEQSFEDQQRKKTEGETHNLEGVIGKSAEGTVWLDHFDDELFIGGRE